MGPFNGINPNNAAAYIAHDPKIVNDVMQLASNMAQDAQGIGLDSIMSNGNPYANIYGLGAGLADGAADGIAGEFADGIAGQNLGNLNGVLNSSGTTPAAIEQAIVSELVSLLGSGEYGAAQNQYQYPGVQNQYPYSGVPYPAVANSSAYAQYSAIESAQASAYETNSVPIDPTTGTQATKGQLSSLGYTSKPADHGGAFSGDAKYELDASNGAAVQDLYYLHNGDVVSHSAADAAELTAIDSNGNSATIDVNTGQLTSGSGAAAQDLLNLVAGSSQFQGQGAAQAALAASSNAPITSSGKPVSSSTLTNSAGFASTASTQGIGAGTTYSNSASGQQLTYLNDGNVVSNNGSGTLTITSSNGSSSASLNLATGSLSGNSSQWADLYAVAGQAGLSNSASYTNDATSMTNLAPTASNGTPLSASSAQALGYSSVGANTYSNSSTGQVLTFANDGSVLSTSSSQPGVTTITSSSGATAAVNNSTGSVTSLGGSSVTSTMSNDLLGVAAKSNPSLAAQYAASTGTAPVDSTGVPITSSAGLSSAGYTANGPSGVAGATYTNASTGQELRVFGDGDVAAWNPGSSTETLTSSSGSTATINLSTGAITGSATATMSQELQDENAFINGLTTLQNLSVSSTGSGSFVNTNNPSSSYHIIQSDPKITGATTAPIVIAESSKDPNYLTATLSGTNDTILYNKQTGSYTVLNGNPSGSTSSGELAELLEAASYQTHHVEGVPGAPSSANSVSGGVNLA